MCPLGGVARPFSPVYVNETLTFDFADREGFERHHFCFHVSDAEFDTIFGRMQAGRSSTAAAHWARLTCRSTGASAAKNVYWQDADGHLWEMLTVSYARPDSPSLTAVG